MRYSFSGICLLGFVATLQAPDVIVTGRAQAEPAAVTCAMGGTGQLTVRSPAVVLTEVPGAMRFQVLVEVSGTASAQAGNPRANIPAIPAEISGSATFSLRPGERFEEYDNRAAAGTTEMVIPLSGMAADDRTVLSGFAELADGDWRTVPGTYRLHATNLALTIPAAGPCHVSDAGPVGEFFVQPRTASGSKDSAFDNLRTMVRPFLIGLFIVTIGVVVYRRRARRSRGDS